VQLATPYTLGHDGLVYRLAQRVRRAKIDIRLAHLSSGANSHTCGLAVDGHAYCWGEIGEGGVLGDGNRRFSQPGLFFKVVTDVTFSTVSTTLMSTCALDAPGAVYCWGEYTSGFGVPSTEVCQGVDSPIPCNTTPQRLAGDAPAFRTLVGGSMHLCALTLTRQALCWGSNKGGQLGTGDTRPRDFPTPVGTP
jgi:alpha-tubulin suppressor-like RCC1 family protein